MLAKRDTPTEEPIGQKIMFYATVIFLLIYFLKFMRHMIKTNKQSQITSNITNSRSYPSVESRRSREEIPSTKEEIKSKRHKKRRYHRMEAERWLPKREPSFGDDIDYDE